MRRNPLMAHGNISELLNELYRYSKVISRKTLSSEIFFSNIWKIIGSTVCRFLWLLLECRGGWGGGVSHVNGLVTPVTSILSNSWTLVQFRPSSLHFYIVMIIKHHLTKMVMATIGMGWGGGGVHEYQTSISNIQSHTRRSEYMVIGQSGMKTQCEGCTKHVCMYVRNMHIRKYSSPKMVNFEDVPLPL